MKRTGILGATGLVGRTMAQVMKERLPEMELVYFGSPDKWGRKIGKAPVIPIAAENIPELDYALFAVSAEVSRKWASIFAAKGITVIDNSSAFRMQDDIPLVVPEINAHAIKAEDRVIANPNCSTIGMVMAVFPLFQEYEITSIHVATYQAVSGAGRRGVQSYLSEFKEIREPSTFDRPILGNLIPFIGALDNNDFCTEELKTIFETEKILERYIPVFPHVVRVPVENAHSEAITITLDRKADIRRMAELLTAASGVVYSERPVSPLEVTGSDLVYVSRLRVHPRMDKTVQMWVVFDNVRKGAATNAVQILDYISGRFA